MSEIRELVARVLTTLDAFGAVLTAETTALRRMDFTGAKSLGDRKASLAHAAHKEIAELRQRHVEINAWLEEDAPAKASFVDGWTRLSTALGENVYTVQRAEAAVRTVVGAIVDTTRRTQRSLVSYGPISTAGVYGRAPRPVTVNRTL